MVGEIKKMAMVITVAYAFSASAQIQNGIKNSTDSEIWLVSPAEALTYQGEAGFNEPPALRARAVQPVIDILKPEHSDDLRVKAPFSIAVQFVAQADAAIDPSSFKVLYGAFNIDITNRITKFVKVSQRGFMLDNAQIPIGKHRLTLQVQDEKHRMAEREFRLEVE